MADAGSATLSILMRAQGAAQTAAQVKSVNSAVASLNSRASGLASTLKNNVGGALSTFGGRVKSIGLGLAAGLGVGGLLSLGGMLTGAVTKMRDFGEVVDKTMSITGLGVEKASALAAALSYVGVDAETTIKSLGMAEKNLFKLAGTTKEATAFQKKYGLSLVDTKGKLVDANELLLRSADFFNKNKNRAQVAAAMAAIYGRSWQSLIEVFELGRPKIQAAEETAARLGLTLTGKNLEDILQFRDKTRDLTTAFGGLQLQIGLRLLPKLTDLTVWATTFLSTHGPEITKFFDDLAGFAGNAAGTIGNLVGAAAAFWNGIPGPLRDLLTKGIIADRAISFFFGISPIKVVASLATSALGGVVGGLGKAVGGALAGAGLGKLFVQPVFVTNPGFGGPGGGGGSPIATAGEGAAGAGAAETLGASALGLANLVAGIAAPIIMFDLIPKLFPGPTQNGAGAGSQPAMLTSTGTLSSQQVAMMTGLMPSFQKFVVANGGIPLGGHQEPLVRLAPGDLQELRADARAADSRENRVAAEMAGLTSRQDTANARLQQIAERRYSNHLDVTIPITAIVTATISARSAVRAQTTSRIYGSGSSRTYME